MNTRKQVLIMSALLMLMLITIGIYGAWYPHREDDAEAHFEEQTAERGVLLFARYCRACHGDAGEGGAAGGRLPAAPRLDRPDLQGFQDSKTTLVSAVNATETTLQLSGTGAFKGGSVILIEDERMEVESVDGSRLHVKRGIEHTEATPHSADSIVWLFDTAVLADHVKLITNTITCGRVGTAMPTWGQSQGGPLSDEQIRQLMTVITKDKWEEVQEEAAKEDRRTVLTEAVDGTATTLEVADTSVINDEEAIRIGDERMRVIGEPVELNGKAGLLIVERGILGTTPLDHGAGDTVYFFMDPPPEPVTIVQQACGQFAKAAAPQGTAATIEPFSGQTVDVIAQGVAYDKRTIAVNTGGQVRVRLDNRDAGVQHNIAFYQSSTNIQPVAPDSVGVTFAGVAVDDTVFNIPAAGSYFFRCDVHPTTMTGTFTVQ